MPKALAFKMKRQGEGSGQYLVNDTGFLQVLVKNQDVVEAM